MTEPKQFRLDTAEIKTIADVRAIFDGLDMACTDNAPHWPTLKKYFTIPVEQQPAQS
jgi:hypothetical protein